MRKQTGWLVWLVAAGATLMPAVSYGQAPVPPEDPTLNGPKNGLAPLIRLQLAEVPPDDPIIPLPLGHDRMENGGFFVAAEFLFWRQTVPLHNQVVAVRGILDQDGSISQALGGPNVPGSFFGNREAALTTNQVTGPGSYEPGFRITGGWLFESGLEVEINWIHLFQTKYSASAGVDESFGRNGNLLQNTFLTAFVFNAPPEFAGPATKVALGGPGATFGIWDAATTMTEEFVQRFEQVELSARIPLMGNDCNRTYWMIGPRADWLWQRYKWRTVSVDLNTGAAGQDDVAIYSNIVSNRLYGVHLGCGYDWNTGTTPVGTFAVSIEGQVAIFADIVKERAKYERGDFAIASQHAITTYTGVAELEGKINLWWYPTSAIQMRIGYDVMTFFNTVSSPDPVSFNYGTLDPPFKSNIVRVFDGFEAGIGFVF
jgi:hypothetical protein